MAASISSPATTFASTSDSTSLIVRTAEGYSLNVKKASEIPQSFIEFLKILEQQPLFTGMSYGIPCKVIPLLDYVDGRMSHLFSYHARKMCEEARCINDFHSDHSYRDSAGNKIQGIALWLLKEKEKPLELCSIDTEAMLYHQIFEKIATGWKRANPEEHPKILHKENSETFALFIKDRPLLISEDVLVRGMAHKFSFITPTRYDVSCHDTWLTADGKLCKETNKIYLWIRTTALPVVIEKLDFKFEGL